MWCMRAYRRACECVSVSVRVSECVRVRVCACACGVCVWRIILLFREKPEKVCVL